VTTDTHRPSQTIEDYLQVILTMDRENEPVILARIKERLGVSAPTALAALRRMERDGLLKVQRHHVELTESGVEAAQSIIRRHMLAERLLIDVLKIDWADAHEEAHRMEHAISPIIERHLLALLGQPTTCPHGNPIPGMDSIKRQTRPLVEVGQGEHVVIANISEHAEEDHDLMRYLYREGLVPDVQLAVAEIVGSNGTMIVAIGKDERMVTLGIPAARVIQVQAAA
jgi:DtxR family Mn-dependent transcriptional regulator